MMTKHQSSSDTSKRRRRRRCNLPDTSFALALFTAAASASSALSKTTAQEEPAIIATYGPHLYYTQASPSNIDYTKLTRINYSSFQINNYGKIYEANPTIDPMVLYGPYDWNPDASKRDVKYCHKNSPELGLGQCAHHFYEQGLIGLSHMNGVQVFASVGNAGDGWVKREEEVRQEAEVFKVVASTARGRQEFAEQCAWLITNYRLDGIDIQWKYPQTEKEMTDYGLLLHTVRERLNDLEVTQGNGSSYGLTASMPCNSYSGNDDDGNATYDEIITTQISNFDTILTELNLDTVDFHGHKAKTAGFNAPLYTNTDEVDYASVSGCVLQYLQNGASRSKLNVGLAFYGHSYKDAVDIGDACTSDWLGECSDTNSWNADHGSPRYHNLYDYLPAIPLYWDDETLTPLAFNKGGVVSYDDPKSICYKTEYAMMNQLNGVIIQELGADMLLDNSTPLLDAVNFKMLNANVDCGGADFEKLFQWREVTSSSTVTTSGINGNGAVTEADAVTVDGELDESKTTVRYTCGFAYGDAKERCSDPGWDDISCETGTCPEEGMMCYVIRDCLKPKNYALSGEKESYAEIWVKSEPKPLPHRKPEKITKGKPIASKVEAATDEAGDSLITSTKDRVRACGSNYYDAAGNCRAACPNGHSDCPSGEFCWHVECGATPPVTTTTSTPYSGPMFNKYQCGFDRTEALTCQEECNGWTCGGDKECYLVPCRP
ncbi:hypothetical protein ACHAWT_006216 [Skeletonema menzelii]